MSNGSFTLPAYAKINWRLHVLGRRADGYHELCTVLQTITLHDRLHFARRDDNLLSLSCDDPSIPADDSNLVLRAARALSEKFSVSKGADIYLEKRIPAQAGLGGGSSDAAVALLGLARLWQLQATRDELAAIGARLGADVPFFFTGGTALGLGLGAEIEQLSDVRAEHLLIVKPRAGVSTAEAYKVLQRPALTKQTSDIILSISRAEALFRDSLPEALHNDFEPPIYSLYPEIGRARELLITLGARGALLAGSGASVFGIFDSREESRKAQSVLEREEGWRVEPCSTLARREYEKALGFDAAFPFDSRD